MITPFSPHSAALPRCRAFSLLELIVVMGIITLMVSVGAYAFRGGGEGTAVSTSASIVSSAISGARQLAVASNRRTRFIILTNSPDNPEDWRLRRFAVLQEVAEISGTVPYFAMITNLDYLRAGIFFSEDKTEKQEEGTGSATSMFSENRVAHLAIQNIAEAEYAYIEFTPTGATTRSGSENIFVIERAPEAGHAIPNNQIYVRLGVAQHTGRVKFERP